MENINVPIQNAIQEEQKSINSLYFQKEISALLYPTLRILLNIVENAEKVEYVNKFEQNGFNLTELGGQMNLKRNSLYPYFFDLEKKNIIVIRRIYKKNAKGRPPIRLFPTLEFSINLKNKKSREEIKNNIINHKC
jgi:hypothetical protein